MKPLTWKKGRLAKIGGILFLFLVIFYFISRGSPSSDNESRLPAHQSWNDGNYAKEVPWFTAGQLGNFEPAEETPGDGPGEGGKAAKLPPEKEEAGEISIGEFSMNIALSDIISLERTIPDTRNSECKNWNYPKNMGLTASVVIVFFNEGFSTVMRNVHTVIKRSPPEMLKEIVLVDDEADNVDLKEKADEHIKQFNGLVKIIRNSEREGLIRARVIGAEHSTGDVIVFLDAHCEVNRNWLPPLLAPIYKDRTALTVPLIDGVDHRTFEYRPVYSHNTCFRGIFEWGMLYKETELLPSMDTRVHKSEPYPSPTHAGGLFAIDRQYFFDLGGYDPGLLIWGGENFELSFKVWQCGGSVLWVPCSRVGHVYRGSGAAKYRKFKKRAKKDKGPTTTINYKRVIEVWFDDKHKEFFYTRDPMARFVKTGDISAQLAIKEKYQCKSFTWFMENVASDLLNKFPELPPNIGWGELKNKGSALCLDSLSQGPNNPIGISGCHGHGGNQFFRLNAKGQMGFGERCIDLQHGKVAMIYCKEGTVNGPWSYDHTSNTLEHTTENKCLAVDPSNTKLILRECDKGNTYHQWVFHELKPKDYF